MSFSCAQNGAGDGQFEGQIQVVQFAITVQLRTNLLTSYLLLVQ